MCKRLCCLLVFVVALSSSFSFAAVNSKKVTLPMLTNCSVYQLGSDEFVLKLTGKKLPEPAIEFLDDTMHLTLNDAMARDPEAVNLFMEKTAEASPLIYEFNLENISEDNKYRVEISVKVSYLITIDSCMRSPEGWTLRIKTLDYKNPLTDSMVRPPQSSRSSISPTDSLPFRVNSRVTVELRDAELRDVMRMLMAQIGRNIIIDSSFPETLVTMSLENVRVDEVLNHIMRTYDIACYPSGKNTTTFGAKQALYKLSGANEMKAFGVSYAEPAQMKSLLVSLASVPDSSITVDERMRMIYVNTNPAKMSEVEELIARLDSPQRQVMIQASIFEFSDSAAKDVENALQVAYDEWQFSLGGPGGITIDYAEDRSIYGDRSLLRTARTIQSQFNAIERKGKGKVIANPSVIALEGRAASINLTEDYPYISTRDEAGNATWSTEEVGPKLNFTPRIGRDGYVNLTLTIETGEVIEMITGSTGERMPRTSTRNVTTEIRVREGMPFVIGGLFRENHSTDTYRVPIIGSLPLIGDLFTSKTNSNVKTQVVIVVTPYILDSK